MIELRKVKVVDRMSEETVCFVAEVFVDGKKVGVAENRGHGGNTMVSFSDRSGGRSPTEERITAYVRDVRKPEHCFDGPAAFLVDEAIEAYLVKRDEEKLAKKIARIDVKQAKAFEAQGLTCIRMHIGEDIRWAGLPAGRTVEEAREHFTKKYGEISKLVVVA